jgi:sugar lactone lactonase YvrE
MYIVNQRLSDMVNLSKRRLLKQGLCGLSVYGIGAIWSNLLIGGCSNQQNVTLLAADANGVRLPAGYSSRIIASSSQPVLAGQAYLWHAAPDGGACFATGDGGWIYVSNSEVTATGGVGAIKFDADGKVIDAYAILENTSRNCAGGATPWGSWLSCEEIDKGRVWECDPAGKVSAVVRPALGVFNHEAVAVDEKKHHLYLTEDKPDGCLYRFTAGRLNDEGYPDLAAGVLEVAVLQNAPAAETDDTLLNWVVVPDPLALSQETRYQVATAMRFNGGEGIAYYNEQVIFSSKGDNRIWSYQTETRQLKVLYDASSSLTPILTGVDDVIVSPAGDIYVAEDGGDLQIVVIDNQGILYTIAQLEGHDKSEVTGLAFSPDGKRLYFSSQRGTTGLSENGITYEIQGF